MNSLIIHPSIYNYLPGIISPGVIFFLHIYGISLNFLFLPVSLLVLLSFSYSWIDLNSRKYKIEHDCITATKGILNKKSISIRFDQINNVKFESDVFQRLFGLGNVYVDTAGGPTQVMVLVGVERPGVITEMIYERKPGGAT